MRQLKAAIVVGLVFAMGYAVGGRAESTGTCACAHEFPEHFPRYEWAVSALQEVASSFDMIRAAASQALSAPDAEIVSMLTETVALFLESSRAHAIRTGKMAGVPAEGWADKYLLGEGGLFEGLSAAVTSYANLVSVCSDVLAPYYEAKCLEDWGTDPRFCWEGVGRVMVEGRRSDLLGWVDRAEAFAKLALKAVAHIESDPTASTVTDDLLSIHAYCGAAAGYPTVIVLQPGDLGDLEQLRKRSEEQRQRDLENYPSSLGRLLNGLEQLDADLMEAVGTPLDGS